MPTTTPAEPSKAAIQAIVHVVDDDPAIRKSLRWLIESIGLPVRTYPSAQAFLEGYEPGVPGCVILDVRMPGMGGLDLQERLREYGYSIPVIVVTGYGDVPMAVRAMKAGAIDFIEKPVSDQVLIDHIQRAIEQDQERHRRRAESADILRRMQTLSKRERQVMKMVIAGMSSREIAAELHVSFKTVEAHRHNVMRKMESRSVPHLIQLNLQVKEFSQAIE